MIAAVNATSLTADPAARERARGRLYVMCQMTGWGALMVVQLAVTNALAKEGSGLWAAPVHAATLCLLITHYTRPFVARWGWKELGVRALLPRVVGMSLLQASVLCAVCYAIAYAVLPAQTQPKIPLLLQFAISFINTAVVMMVWFSFYFFYNVYERNHRLELDRARLAATIKDAELRALQSQVNPHFIFNALNSLRALIDEDPVRAREAVTQLANLLRYSLQSAQAETVAFEDELRVVNDYLALEQVRHEERLRVRLEIEPETLDLAVPPLLLQTLVENAVKYGISTRPEGGEIVITARRIGGQLELRVINPGELPRGGASLRLPGNESTGLGLKNAAERLRVFFGDRARLVLRAESASHVVAEVFIPIQPLRA
jgi:hypothetical protein